MTPFGSRRILVLAALAASACGGGGGGGGAAAVPATVDVELVFPPSTTMTTESTLTVRGETSNGPLVADLRANGVNAASVDGFRTWTAATTVPLSSNVIRVEGTDRRGRSIGPKNVVVERASDGCRACGVVVGEGAVVEKRPPGRDGRERRADAAGADDEDSHAASIGRPSVSASRSDGVSALYVGSGSTPRASSVFE